MTAAQIAHAIVSFIFMERAEGRKPTREWVSAREMLARATTVRDCLEAYTVAEDRELPDERVFDRLKKFARTFDDWLDISKKIDQESGLGKLVSERLTAAATTFLEWEWIYLAATSNLLREQAMEKTLSLPATFLDLEGFYKCIEDPKFREAVLKRMVPLAHTLEEKVCVYDLSGEGSQARQDIARDLTLTAKNFEEWRSIFETAEGGSDFEHFAVAKMVELAPETLSELANLLSYDVISALHDELRDAVFQRLKQVRASFEEWETAFENAEDDSDFERFAASMLVDNVPADAEKLANLLGYGCVYDDAKLRETTLEKLRQAPATFEVWKELRGDETDEVRAIATEKMIAAVEDVDQVIEAAEAIDDDEDGQGELAARVKTLTLDEKALEGILDDYGNDSFLFSAAFEKLVEMADTAIRCLYLYATWETSDDDGDKALDKLFSLATREECSIIALSAEDESALHERAEKRLAEK